MKEIDIEGVQPGDILFTARPGKLERTIRRFTAGGVSHAMICVGPGSFIDATQAGVQADNLQEELFADDEKAHRFRLKAAATQDTIDRIVNYARSQIDTRHSVPDAVWTVIPAGSLTLTPMDRRRQVPLHAGPILRSRDPFLGSLAQSTRPS